MNPATTPLPLNEDLKFYGVDNEHFKVGRKVFQVVCDPDDGYRSCLGSIEVADKEAAKKLIFFKRAVDTVQIVEDNDGEFSGYKVVSTTDQHVWLKFGTDYCDDYYPCFVFEYTPRVK